MNKEFKSFTETDFYEKPETYKEGNFGDYWFCLKEDKYKILCDDSKTTEEQEKVLAGFFESVLKAIGAEEYLK